MNKGSIFVISGPSGSGKDTILVKLFEKQPELCFSISSITRNMRDGEVEGEKYHFISREEFEDLIKNDMLLEYNEFVGNYYGTPRLPVEEAINCGKDMVIEVDVNGAKQIRSKMPEVVSIFIMPPSYEELKRRLTGRGTDAKEVIESRLKMALDEINRAKEYDYIVVNDKIDQAVNDVLHIILSEHLKVERQKNKIDEVLELC